MKVEKAPVETYADIGGLEDQIQEIKEAVELPLAHPELYEDIGIKPPKGVILYGEPGTGKTLLAKAVANQTSATFLRVVGSELIQKYLGDGPKLVRELFRVADDLSPSIVFIGRYFCVDWDICVCLGYCGVNGVSTGSMSLSLKHIQYCLASCILLPM
jgi:26S proteasome regulatory subunit T2